MTPTARLTLVMGVKRSGTTALFRALARDPRLTSFDEGEGPLFRDPTYLRPEPASRQFLEDHPHGVLVKALDETTTRGVRDVLDEFAAHAPQIIWLYRDPVNVFQSWIVEGWTIESRANLFAREWNVRNRRMLSALGTHGSRILVIRYEDLILDTRVWTATCRAACIAGTYGFRSDSRAGRRLLSSSTQSLIDGETLEVWGDLDRVRSIRPGRAALLLTAEGRAQWRHDRQRELPTPTKSHPVAARSPGEFEDVRLWLDAGTIPAGPDRGPVTHWPARRGSSADAAPGRHGAVLAASSVNGQPALFFPPRRPNDPEGAPGFECGTDEDWRFLYDGSPWTILLVYRAVPSTETGTLLVAGRADNRSGFVFCSTAMAGQWCLIGSPRGEAQEDVVPVIESVPIRIPGDPDGWRVTSCVHDPKGGSHAPRPVLTAYIGAHLVSEAHRQPGLEYPQGPSTGGLSIGSIPGYATHEFSGDIAEVVIFSVALDDHARSGVVRYLIEKYGLT